MIIRVHDKANLTFNDDIDALWMSQVDACTWLSFKKSWFV